MKKMLIATMIAMSPIMATEEEYTPAEAFDELFFRTDLLLQLIQNLYEQLDAKLDLFENHKNAEIYNHTN